MKTSSRKFLYVILWLSFNSLLSAQFTADYWPLDQQSIDFGTNPPKLTSNVPYDEAFATTTIGDSLGKLLFFATQNQVFDALGDSLAGGNFAEISEYDFAEQPLLVPIPKSKGRFLLFVKLSSDISINEDGSIANDGGFYVIELDIALNGGMGGVVPDSRRQVGSDYVFQKLTAVHDPDSGDYWVLGRNYTGIQFVAYRITSTGLVDAPVVTNVNLPPVDDSFFNTQLKFSPDAKYVTSAYSTPFFDVNMVNGFILFSFNSSNGVLDLLEIIDLPTRGRHASGIEFSSDATKLYVYQNGSTGEEGLYQYDLTVLPEPIANTQIDLGEFELTGGGGLQLAPDGKIYITKGGGSADGANYLGVVNQPNEIGNTADFVELGLFIAEGATSVSVFELPNVVQSFYYRNSIHHDRACANQTVHFSPTNDHLVRTTEWDFGDGSPSSSERAPQHIYTDAGQYTVQLIVGGATGLDTLTQEVTVLPSTILDLGEDRSVCTGSFISPLGSQDNFISYAWNTSDTTATLRIDTAGTYILSTINNEGCLASDSVTLDISPIPEIVLPDSIEITSDNITLTPGDFDRYTWSTGDSTPTLNITEPRFYSVVVEDSLGCRADKTFLTYRGVPPPTVRRDETWRLINPRPSCSNARRIHYLNSDNGFVLTDQELLVTRDGGKRWEKKLDVDQALDIQFAGRTGYLMSRRFFYKSTYNGRGWNPLPVGDGPFVGFSLIGNDTIVLSSDDVNRVSTDGGRTWVVRDMTSAKFTAATIHFTSLRKGFCVGTNGNLYATEDGGNAWEQRGEAPGGNSSSDHQIVFFDDQLGFATRGRGGIYRTDNGGKTWTEPNLRGTRYFGIDFIDHQKAYLVGELGAIAFTNNGGLTWEGRNRSLNLNDGWKGAYFTDQNHGTVVGLFGRIATTKDGGRTWNNYAPTYRRINNAHLDSTGNGYLVSQGDYFTTYNAGESWQRRPAILDGENTLNVVRLNDSIELAIVERSSHGVSDGNTLHLSKDGGDTWENVNLGLNISEDIDDILRFNDSVAYVTTIDAFPSRTFRTNNSGQTWEEVSIPLFKKINSVNDTLAYAISTRKSLYRSTDGGLTWMLNLSGEFGQEFTEFSFPSAAYGYLVGESGVRLRTTDGGQNWTTMEGLDYDDYLAVVFTSPLRGYAVNDGGLIYRTDDAGENWRAEFGKFGIENLKLGDGTIVGYGDFGRFYTRSAVSEPTAAFTSTDLNNITSTAADLRLQLFSTIDTLRVEVTVRKASNSQQVYANSLVATSGESNIILPVTGLESNTRYLVNTEMLTLMNEVVDAKSVEFVTSNLVNNVEPSEFSELILYPSPTSGPLYYRMPVGVGAQPFRLLDATGRLVINGLLRQGNGRLDLTSHKPGLYFLQIGSVNGGQVSYPVVRQ